MVLAGRLRRVLPCLRLASIPKVRQRGFRVFSTTQDLIDHAKSIVPCQLMPYGRKRFFLTVEGEVGNCPN